jgi:transposase
MPTYPLEFKKKMVARMTGPQAMTASALGRETGVSHSTLSQWLRQAATLGAMSETDDSSKLSKPAAIAAPTAQDKLRILTLTASLDDQEIGALLRREGLLHAQLEQWRIEVLDALSGRRARDEQDTDSRRRIQELEREIARKDKALAEAAALLMLQKKVRAMLEGADENTPRRSGR